jgi:hypothetical protein
MVEMMGLFVVWMTAKGSPLTRKEMMFMRSLLTRALLAVSALLVIPAPHAQAYLGYYSPVPTVYVEPTSSVLTVPSTYVVPTSYVWPTSYVTPTVYATSAVTPTYYVEPTAYVVPTTYAATSYVATGYYVRRPWWRPFFGRRWAYYEPAVTATSWSYPVVATAPVVAAPTYSAGDCCASAPVVAAAPMRSYGAPSAMNGNSSGRRPSVVDSVPANEPGLSSQRTVPMPNTEPPSPPTPGALAPPANPAPDTGGEAPVAPGGAAAAGQRQGAGSLVSMENTRRDAQKPRSLDPSVRQVSAGLGILEGKVITAESGQPEADVRVILSDHRGRFDDRIAISDANGRFRVNLPEGDWTVRVEMPSRRVYAVSELTVSSGQITDNIGRDVPSLIIKR